MKEHDMDGRAVSQSIVESVTKKLSNEKSEIKQTRVERNEL